MGKFYKTLSPVSASEKIEKTCNDMPLFQGLNLLLPVIDNIRYVQSLKEIAIEIPSQTAISKGNETILDIKSTHYLRLSLFRQRHTEY